MQYNLKLYIIMDKEELLETITVLIACIEPLRRSDQFVAVDKITAKILELVERIK